MNEFLRRQLHHLLTRFVAVVLPVKADLTLREVNQPVVGMGDAVRVVFAGMTLLVRYRQQQKDAALFMAEQAREYQERSPALAL